MSIPVGVSSKSAIKRSLSEEKIRGEIQLLSQATIGRITSIIVHQINNPLQAIQGAATLGIEELDDPQAVKTYLEMIRGESSRIFRMTEILRGIYHPDLSGLEPVSIKQMIDDVLLFIKDDFNRKDITFTITCPDNLEPVRISESQFLVVLMNVFLDLNDAIFAAGRKLLALNVHEIGEEVILDFSTDFPLKTSPAADTKNIITGLPMIRRILQSNGGSLDQGTSGTGSRLSVSLPTRGFDEAANDR